MDKRLLRKNIQLELPAKEQIIENFIDITEYWLTCSSFKILDNTNKSIRRKKNDIGMFLY